MRRILLGIGVPANMSSTSDAVSDWRLYFDELLATGRTGMAELNIGDELDDGAAGLRFWVPAEQAHAFQVVYPQLRWTHPPAAVGTATTPSRSDAIFQLVNGWMQHSGPITAAQLAQQLAIPSSEVEHALLRIESAGTVLRGHFSPPSNLNPTEREMGDRGRETELEWCERRLLARIHRLTLGRLRKEIEPAMPAEFMRWLLRWQHLTPGTQVRGERGLVEVLQQLQGFEIPANAWERMVLARRVLDYDPKMLDQLCLGGAVGWGRLSPHPATLHTSEPDASRGPAPANRRVIPTSVAPITFFVREEADWMIAALPAVAEPQGLSPSARRVFEFLQQRGASFFGDIVRQALPLKAELETALWELVAAGLVTADGFDNLRALIDPKRRAGQGHGRMARPRHSAGRWSLLRSPVEPGGTPAESRARALESTCWMLLRRYGVVFRELLAREAVAPKWRELQLTFRRLEDRGEIRGGRFVSGFLGEQFALPVAVDSLRAERKRQPAGEAITLSAVDPLNLVGIIVPGERVSALSGKQVTFRDGVAVTAPEPAAMPVQAVM